MPAASLAGTLAKCDAIPEDLLVTGLQRVGARCHRSYRMQLLPSRLAFLFADGLEAPLSAVPGVCCKHTVFNIDLGEGPRKPQMHARTNVMSICQHLCPIKQHRNKRVSRVAVHTTT